MFKVLSILILVLAANAYDFFNLVNNKYLFDDFNVLNNVGGTFGHRRGADHDSNKKDGIQICCTGDKYDSENQKRMEVFNDQCMNQLKFSIGDMTYPRSNDVLACLSECTFRAVNLINENGKFNRKDIVEYIDKLWVVGIEWKKAVLEEYVDDCLTKAAATQSNAAMFP